MRQERAFSLTNLIKEEKKHSISAQRSTLKWSEDLPHKHHGCLNDGAISLIVSCKPPTKTFQ